MERSDSVGVRSLAHDLTPLFNAIFTNGCYEQEKMSGLSEMGGGGRMKLRKRDSRVFFFSPGKFLFQLMAMPTTIGTCDLLRRDFDRVKFEGSAHKGVVRFYASIPWGQDWA